MKKYVLGLLFFVFGFAFMGFVKAEKIVVDDLVTEFNKNAILGMFIPNGYTDEDGNQYDIKSKVEGDKFIIFNDVENSAIEPVEFTFDEDGITYANNITEITANDVNKELVLSFYTVQLMFSVFELSGCNHLYDLKNMDIISAEDSYEKNGIIMTTEEYTIHEEDETGSATYSGDLIRVFKMSFDKDVIKKFIDENGVRVPTASLKKAKNNAFNVSWDFTPYDKKYAVEYSTDGKKWTTKTVTGSSFTHSKLTYGKTYYYRVKGYDGKDWSKYSKVVKKKLVPNKVTLNTVTVGKKNVKISWAKEGITGYEIYMGTSAKKLKKVKTITKNSTISFNKTGLKSKKTYYFKARAYKTVKGKKVYGSYGNVLKVKTK